MNEPEVPQFETVRGVTYPVEPGASPLRRMMARNKIKKRMKRDDRLLKALKILQGNEPVVTRL